MAPEGNRHTWLEDLQAIVTAVAFASLGLRPMYLRNPKTAKGR